MIETSAGVVRALFKTAVLLSALYLPAGYATEPATAAPPEVPADTKPVAPATVQPVLPAEHAPAATAAPHMAQPGTTAAPPPPAVKVSGIDAVLVLDSSGSMKHTDPLNLRLPAAKLFIALLGKADRAGVISFSDRGYPLAALMPAHDDAARQKLLQAVDKVESNGQFTNLHDALLKARAMLGEQQDDRPRYVILMSDGQMDTGNAARDAQLTAQLKDTLIPELTKAHITLYTIAFTPASDVALLKAIAEATRGQFRLALLDKDLHDVFTSLFESAKTPDMLPIEGGEFHADDAIQEVTVVATKDNPKVQIFLQAPDGKRLAATDAAAQNKAMRWYSSPAFDMITLDHPAAGVWKVLFSTGKNKAYIVTDLGIVTDLKDQQFKRGATLTVTAWLNRGGEIVKQPDILTSTQFTIQMQGPGGAVNEFIMRDTGQLGDKVPNDGIYTATVPLITIGQQKLHLVAKSATFQRETTRDITVIEPPAVVPAAPAAQPAVAKPVVKHAAPPEPVAVPKTPPPVEEKGLSMAWLLGGFVLFNLLVAGGVILVLWWRRRRPATLAAPADDNEAEDDAVQTTPVKGRKK